MATRPEIPNLFSAIYRTNQTAIGGILLAEKMTDLISALDHLCRVNNLAVSEGTLRLMSEIEFMLKRMEEINSLTMPELLKLPPLTLSPGAGQPDGITRRRDNTQR